MAPDAGTFVSFGSLILAAGTLLFAVLSARASRNSKEERQAALLQGKRQSERLEAEEERISVNAAREAVRLVNHQLERANRTIDEQQTKIDAQNERIDKQNRIIRRQNVRLELQQEQIDALHRTLVANNLHTTPLATPPDDDLWPGGEDS